MADRLCPAQLKRREKMTAAELLDNALAVLATTRAESPDYCEYAVPLINLLLAELFEYNNALLAAKGRPEQSGIGKISALDDELPIEEELARTAMPMGLCAQFVMDDDDLAKAAYYRNRYVSAVEEAGRWITGPIVDFYAGDDR